MKTNIFSILAVALVLALPAHSYANQNEVLELTSEGASECGKLAVASVRGGSLLEDKEQLSTAVNKVQTYILVLKEMKSLVDGTEKKLIEERLLECSMPLARILS